MVGFWRISRQKDNCGEMPDERTGTCPEANWTKLTSRLLGESEANKYSKQLIRGNYFLLR